MKPENWKRTSFSLLEEDLQKLEEMATVTGVSKSRICSIAISLLYYCVALFFKIMKEEARKGLEYMEAFQNAKERLKEQGGALAELISREIFRLLVNEGKPQEICELISSYYDDNKSDQAITQEDQAKIR